MQSAQKLYICLNSSSVVTVDVMLLIQHDTELWAEVILSISIKLCNGSHLVLYLNNN